MINKNLFSAVLVSIFVLSVFSFLSGNALAEETCGNGVCDIGEETTYNCPADCLLPGDDFHEDYTINTSQPAIINTFDGTEYEIKVEYNGCGPNGNINLIIDGKRYENLVLGSRAWVNNWTSVEITGIPCAVDQIALRFWETSEEEPTCTDSDGGKNYYEKGILSGTAVGKTDIIESCYLLNSDGSGSPVDSCDSSDPRCKIYEHWCENGEVLAQGYHCPNGCKDGACIKEKPTCTDSDGGKDYYENGKITYDNGNSETYDLCVNDKTLKEGYCVNGKYNYEYYNCPYGCIVGKCLKSYETGKKYHLDLEKKKIFEITFNGVDYTIDTTQLSCFYSTAHKLIISYDDKTFISDRIGPYEKFNLENGDYLINSGCPTGAPVINLAFIGKKRTTTTTTIPSETGYDVCNNGKGWSEPSSSAQKCGWPSGSKGNMKDCCCCYLTTHVHDLGKIFNEGSSIEIEYKPGWAQGCTSPMFVYYSEDGKEWNLFYNATVTQETWHPKTIYKKTLTVPGDFRYIKIYIPKCYNDYSSAKVIATGGGGGEGAEEEEVSELQCEIKHEVKGEVELSGDAQNTLDELLAKLSSYGRELEIKYKVKKQDGSVSIEKDEISGELNEEEMELWNILKEDVYNLVESTEEDDVELEIEIEVECEEETTEEQPSQSTEVSVQIPETTTTTVVQEDVEKTCSGCWYKYKCVQYGVRITENGVPSYCDFDGAFKVQKENGEDCLNNYECKSNFCSDGECYNIKGELKETKGLLESIMSFLRSLFGFGKK